MKIKVESVGWMSNSWETDFKPKPCKNTWRNKTCILCFSMVGEASWVRGSGFENDSLLFVCWLVSLNKIRKTSEIPNDDKSDHRDHMFSLWHLCTKVHAFDRRVCSWPHAPWKPVTIFFWHDLLGLAPRTCSFASMLTQSKMLVWPTLSLHVCFPHV